VEEERESGWRVCVFYVKPFSREEEEEEESRAEKKRVFFFLFFFSAPALASRDAEGRRKK
jgi:hypothetical protein